MSNDTNVGRDVLAAALGLRCSGVERPSDWLWSFTFGSGERTASLQIECPWRLVAEGAIAFGDQDHDQRFGLPVPVDGPRHCMRYVSGRTVNDVDLRSDVGDLVFLFDNDVRLELFNHSSGYEGWSFSVKGGRTVTAQGGGSLAISGPA